MGISGLSKYFSVTKCAQSSKFRCFHKVVRSQSAVDLLTAALTVEIRIAARSLELIVYAFSCYYHYFTVDTNSRPEV